MKLQILSSLLIKLKKLKNSKSIEIKRTCLECKKRGYSPSVYSSHIRSNKSCPAKLEIKPIIVSSKKHIVNDKSIENEKQSFKTDINISERELNLNQIKEKAVGIRIVNSLLGKRANDDSNKKLSLPVIPKRKLPLSEGVFYDSPVKIFVTEKKEDKALTILKSKRAKLMGNQKEIIKKMKIIKEYTFVRLDH